MVFKGEHQKMVTAFSALKFTLDIQSNVCLVSPDWCNENHLPLSENVFFIIYVQGSWWVKRRIVPGFL